MYCLTGDEMNYEEESETEYAEPQKEVVESDFEGHSDIEQPEIEDIAVPHAKTKKPTAKSILKSKAAAAKKRQHKKVEFEYETEDRPVRKQKIQSLRLNF